MQVVAMMVILNFPVTEGMTDECVNERITGMEEGSKVRQGTGDGSCLSLRSDRK